MKSLARTFLHVKETVDIKYETRLLREASTARRHGISERIVIAGRWEPGKARNESVGEGIRFERLSMLRGARYPVLRPLRRWDAQRRLLALAGREKPNIVECHEVDTLEWCAAIKRKLRIPLVYAPHELETERNLQTPAKRLWAQKTERQLIDECDAVICVADAIADWYAQAYKIKKPTVVRNIPEQKGYADRTPTLRKRFSIPSSHTVFIYQGALFHGRRIEQLLRVFGRLNKDRHIAFMGYGPLESLIRTEAARHSNIHLHPPVRPEDVLRYSADADVGLVGVDKVCLSYYYSLPNKLFEYLAAGLPVIANNWPEMGKLVEHYDCGWLAGDSEDDWLAIIQQIDARAIKAKRSGVDRARRELTWEHEEARLINVYRQLLH